MSYKRMKEVEPELAREVQAWPESAQAGDDAEDTEHGNDNRGDKMPAHILGKVKKLAKIRASMAELESEGIAEKLHVEAGRAAKEEEQGSKISGPKPKDARRGAEGQGTTKLH